MGFSYEIVVFDVVLDELPPSIWWALCKCMLGENTGDTDICAPNPTGTHAS